MKAVYEAPYAIPELGAQKGDFILVEPAHPEVPLIVYREFDRNHLPAILDHVDSLTLRSLEGVSTTPLEVRRWISEHARRTRPRHLKAVR